MWNASGLGIAEDGNFPVGSCRDCPFSQRSDPCHAKARIANSLGNSRSALLRHLQLCHSFLKKGRTTNRRVEDLRRISEGMSS